MQKPCDARLFVCFGSFSDHEIVAELANLTVPSRSSGFDDMENQLPVQIAMIRNGKIGWVSPEKANSSSVSRVHFSMNSFVIVCQHSSRSILIRALSLFTLSIVMPFTICVRRYTKQSTILDFYCSLKIRLPYIEDSIIGRSLFSRHICLCTQQGQPCWKFFISPLLEFVN